MVYKVAKTTLASGSFNKDKMIPKPVSSIDYMLYLEGPSMMHPKAITAAFLKVPSVWFIVSRISNFTWYEILKCL